MAHKKPNIEFEIDPYIDTLERLAEAAREWVSAENPSVQQKRQLIVASYLEELDDVEAKRAEAEQDTFDDLVEKFFDLEEERIKLEAALKRNAEAIKELTREEGKLYTQWIEKGSESIKRRGRTMFLRIDSWLFRKKDTDPKAAILALKRARLGAMVNESYSAQSLRAYLREREEANKPLPPSIQKHFEIERRVSFRTNRSSR